MAPPPSNVGYIVNSSTVFETRKTDIATLEHGYEDDSEGEWSGWYSHNSIGYEKLFSVHKNCPSENFFLWVP